MDQDTLGRLQVYLVLGAIASADFAQAAPFKDTVGARRAKLYKDGLDIAGNQQDRKYFFDNLTETLINGGFDSEFIKKFNFNNFLKPGVWEALKTLNKELLLISEYTGTDCPCITVLVGYARSQEALLGAAQKRMAKIESKT